MKTSNIIILVVGVILIIITLLIISYFAYNSIFGPKPITPFTAGDVVNFSLIAMNDPNFPKYLQLSSQSNCNFQSINLTNQYNSASTLFKIVKDYLEPNKFALVNNNNAYLYLTTDSNYTDYLSWDLNNNQSNISNIWLTMSDAGNNNIYLQTADGRKLGLLAVKEEHFDCYQGFQIDNNKYILAVNNSSPMSFYMTNQTTPIRPSAIKYPFTEGQNVVIKADQYALAPNCAIVSNSSFSTALSYQWKVKFSPDNLAFAVSSNNNYLKAITDANANLIFSATSSILSDYQKGDYSNWFVLNNNKMISLWANASLSYQADSLVTCQGDNYFTTRGTTIESGNNIVFV